MRDRGADVDPAHCYAPFVSKDPTDVLTAAYVAQRADTTAVFVIAVSIISGAVGYMGAVAALVGNLANVNSWLLAILPVIPWPLLAYHSVLVGMNAAHSYGCEILEEEIRNLLSPHSRTREVLKLVGVPIGERFLDPRQSGLIRGSASVYAYVLTVAAGAAFSAWLEFELWARVRATHGQTLFIFALISTLLCFVGLIITVLNHIRNGLRPEVHEMIGHYKRAKREG